MSNVNKGSAKQRITEKIQASRITNRLQAFALSKPGDDNYDKVQMTPAQVTAGFKLLGKVVPDLKQVEQTIKDERKKTKQEIDDALTARGIDPEMLWNEVVRH